MPEQTVNKTLMDKINQGRQYRTVMQMTVRKASEDEERKFIVEGYASTFNEPYTLYDSADFRYDEQIAPEAFAECDLRDCIFQYDHAGRVFARTSNGTLEVKTDDHGLYVVADLGGTEEGRKLYEEIEKGYTTKMSFGFSIGETKEEYTRNNETGKDTCLCTITKISRLYDVSAVSLPANDGTEISARSLVDGIIAKRAQELSEEEKAKAEEEQRKAEAEAKEKERQERKRLALEIGLSLSL